MSASWRVPAFAGAGSTTLAVQPHRDRGAVSRAAAGASLRPESRRHRRTPWVPRAGGTSSPTLLPTRQKRPAPQTRPHNGADHKPRHVQITTNCGSVLPRPAPPREALDRASAHHHLPSAVPPEHYFRDVMSDPEMASPKVLMQCHRTMSAVTPCFRQSNSVIRGPIPGISTAHDNTPIAPREHHKEGFGTPQGHVVTSQSVTRAIVRGTFQRDRPSFR